MNTQHGITLGTVDIKCQITRQCLYGCQVLRGVGEQGFAVQVGQDGEDLVGGRGIRWGFGLSLIMVKLLKNRSCQHHLQMMGGSCARVCKTESGAPRQTQRSPAHSHQKTMTMKSATIIAALASS